MGRKRKTPINLHEYLTHDVRLRLTRAYKKKSTPFISECKKDIGAKTVPKAISIPSALSSPRRRSVLLALCWYDHRVHRGAARYAQEHGWILHSEMCHTGIVPEGWRGDGVLSLVGAGSTHAPLTRFVAGLKCPVVDLGTDHPEIRAARVLPDTTGAGRLAAEHFLRRGFRNFVCYAENRDSTNFGYSSAFRDVLREAGHACELRWWWRRGGAEWSRQRKKQIALLAAAPRPLAVFATSDHLASRVLAAALEAGLRVPDDIAVLGCHNDLLECESAPVPLSSIETNEERLGYEGAALLDRLMSGKPAPKEAVVVPAATVVARMSTDIFAVPHHAVRRVMLFFKENYPRAISGAEIERTAGMSRRGLEKAFQAHLGRLPMQELRRIRFEAAQRLLRGTDAKISAIAAECGFRDATGLGNAFRRNCGLSPKAWRRRETRA